VDSGGLRPSKPPTYAFFTGLKCARVSWMLRSAILAHAFRCDKLEGFAAGCQSP
jgi:hypothetical protein